MQAKLKVNGVDVTLEGSEGEVVEALRKLAPPPLWGGGWCVHGPAYWAGGRCEHCGVLPILGLEWGCAHEYPDLQPWLGTVPPACRKCGQSRPMVTFTIQDGGWTTDIFTTAGTITAGADTPTGPPHCGPTDRG